MAITVVGVGTQTAGTVAGNTIPANYPASYSATAGDLVIILVGGRPSDATMPSAPTGYTARSTQNRATGTVSGATFWKILDGSEASAPTVTIPAAWTGGLSAQMIVLRGVDQSTPFDVADVVGNNVASATLTPTAITTSTDLALVVQTVVTGDDNALSLTTANGFAVQMDGANYDTTAGNDHAVGMATFEKSPAGAVTMPTWTQTAVGNDAWIQITMAVRPASEPPAITGTGAAAKTLSSSASGTATETFTGTGAGSKSLSSSASGAGAQTFTGTGAAAKSLSSSASGAGTVAFSGSGTPASSLSSSASGAGVQTFTGSGSPSSSLSSSASGTGTNTPDSTPAEPTSRGARRKNRRRQDRIHLENLQRRIELEAELSLEEMTPEVTQEVAAADVQRAEEVRQADHEVAEFFQPAAPKAPRPRRPPPINETRFAAALRSALPEPIDLRTLRMIEDEEEERFIRDLLARL